MYQRSFLCVDDPLLPKVGAAPVDESTQEELGRTACRVVDWLEDGLANARREAFRRRDPSRALELRPSDLPPLIEPLCEAMQALGWFVSPLGPYFPGDWWTPPGHVPRGVDREPVWAVLRPDDLAYAIDKWSVLRSDACLAAATEYASSGSLDPFNNDVRLFVSYCEDSLHLLRSVPDGQSLAIEILQA